MKALQLYNIVDDDPTGMEWDTIVQRLNTKYLSLESQNLWSTKDTNAKASSNKLSSLHAKFKKLTAQVRAQDPGYRHKLWTCGVDHIQADCTRKPAGVTTLWERTLPGSGYNRTKMVEGVY